jgi:outer membrane receptor protein involved in Fe transport
VTQKYHRNDTNDRMTLLCSEYSSCGVAAEPNPLRPLNPMQTRRLFAIHALLFFAISATAQVAPSPPSTPASSASGEKPIELSPFTVNADQDVGYVAASSLAGSRLNTPLKDTAASISVMTSEFLSDIGATNLTEALEWGNNVQKVLSDDAAIGTAPGPNGFFSQSDSFRVRGINATLTRNYFEWPLPTDSYNVERIEESRGPNSILFGIGSAGGIINVSTKQAQMGRSFRRAAAIAGSYGSYRGTLDVNQTAFDRRLAVRLNALYDHTGSWRTYGFSDRRRVHLAAAYNITANTRLRAEYEVGDNHENISSGYSIGDASTTWLAAGRPTFTNPIPVPAPNPLNLARYGATRITYVENTGALVNMGAQNFGNALGRPITDESIANRTINSGGPGQLRDSYFSAVSAFLEQKLGKATFVALAYNHQETHSVVLQQFGDSNALTFEPRRAWRIRSSGD